MDQIRKFGEQTSRILEFKPEGLEGYTQEISGRARYSDWFCILSHYAHPVFSMYKFISKEQNLQSIFFMMTK